MSGNVNILMYHSIAKVPGPVAIAPETFRMQLDMLAERGFRGVALREYISSPDTPAARGRMVVLTFDDGYLDFVDIAVPEIESRRWTCTVFVSSQLVGADDGWDPNGAGQRRLIDWRQCEEVAQRGIEVGGHGVTHADLTQLPDEDARREIANCKRAIEEGARCRVTSFAAPYGRTTPAIRQTIASLYDCAVGTRMARASAASDRHDLPRIDMWYFRDRARWSAYLDGSMTYFTIRQLLRNVRLASGLGAPRR